MPREDDNQEDLAPSSQVDDVTEAADAPAQADTEDAGAAGSSPAKDETPKDMSSVVRDVIAKPEDAASSPAKETEDAGKADAPTEAKPEDDTDYKDVPFHTHPRFQQLLRKSKAYEADATRYRNVETFLRDNHLGSDEAADGLRIMALAKTDPAKALEEIKPFVQKLLVAAGEILPDDLKTRVNSQELTAGAALEISRSRAALVQQQEADRLAQERRRQEEVVQRGNALRATAQNWLADREAKDPSFKDKYPLLEREVAFLQRSEGVPNTEEGVREQLNRAYAGVNQQARAMAPSAQPRPATRPIVGGAAPGNHSPQPKTMLDAVRMARGSQ